MMETKTATICKVCENAVPKRKEYQPSVCEACQKFFRRNCERHSGLKCNGVDGVFHNCPTNCKNRRICQSCRFERCLSAGLTSKFFPNQSSSSLQQPLLAQETQPSLVVDNNLETSSSSGAFSLPIKEDESSISPYQQQLSNSTTDSSPLQQDSDNNKILANNNMNQDSTSSSTTMVPFVRQLILYNGTDVEDLLRTSVQAYTTLHSLEFFTLKRLYWPAADLGNILTIAMEQLRAEMAISFAYGRQFTGSLTGLSESEIDYLKSRSISHITAVYNNLLGNRGATFFGLNDSLTPLFLNRFPQFQGALDACRYLQAELETWNPSLIETALLLSYLFFRGDSRTNSEKVTRFQNRLLLAYNLHCSAVSRGDQTLIHTRQLHFDRCHQLTEAATNNLIMATASLAESDPYFATVAEVMNSDSNVANS